jgi:hypothetical protein
MTKTYSGDAFCGAQVVKPAMQTQRVQSYARGGKVRAYGIGGSAQGAGALPTSLTGCQCCSVCCVCCSPLQHYGIGGSIGSVAGSYFGGPVGGAIGNAVGSIFGGLFGCCCCCGPATTTNNYNTTNISNPPLDTTTSELVGHGGNYTIDKPEALPQMQGGLSGMGANPLMGMYQGEMLAEGGSASNDNHPVNQTSFLKNDCVYKQFVSELKDSTPQWACSKCTMLRSEINSNYAKNALQPLKHIRCSIVGNAEGGLAHYKAAAPHGHHPEFITGLTGYYACGGGTGQSDDIPAMLHDGDYVMDAETVSALGDGSSKAGMHVLEGFRQQLHYKDGPGSNPVPAKIADGEYVFPGSFVSALGGGDNKKGSDILDGLREKLREHKRKAPLDSIPPKAKSPIDYIGKK